MTSKCSIINDMLLHDLKHTFHGTGKWVFCVHESMKKNLEKLWHKLGVNPKCDCFRYTVQIGEKCYEMRIIVQSCVNRYAAKRLHTYILYSQFCFPWVDNPTVFIEEKSFTVLQDFIRIHKLKPYILSTEDKPGISANGDIIKVVTFNQSAGNLNIIEKYKTHLKSTKIYPRPQYYYMTFAFPWLKLLPGLEGFSLSVKEQFYSSFLIILHQLGTLKYTKQLNIFDLLSKRLALIDFRNPAASSIVKYELDFLIKRELDHYVINNHLNIDQYHVSTNSNQRSILINYLVYEFQNYFETVQTSTIISHMPGLEPSQLHCTVKLADECMVRDLLKMKTNIKFDIDGHGYDQMSLSLFLDLIECKNVFKIHLDTNYRWINDVCKLKRCVPSETIYVWLFGNNTYNFIEDFLSSLKSVTYTTGTLELYINSVLNDYTVFNNINVNVNFYDIIINTRMLEGLNKCNLKSNIHLFQCTVENSRHNWALINNLKKLNRLEIDEDEGTWQAVYEYVSDELLKTNEKEFHFVKKVFNVWCGKQIISLKGIGFVVDELKQKLVLRNRRSNQIVDLYNKKFGLKPDDKSDYDFYD